MQLNYEEAGLDLNELAENPPYEYPLGTIEGLDLSWWEPMFFYNQLEDGNAKFLKELGLNWEYPPNYEQNYLEALKEEYHDFWEEIKVGKEYIPTQPIEQIYNPRDYVPYEIDELSFLWGSIRGELPHYRGIAIAETYVPKGGNFWGVDATALAAAIALQSQTYHKEKDTKESLVYKLKDLGGEPSSGLGIAQITDAEMSDFGFEGQDQEDPEVAVRAMAKRIRSALSALELVFGENFNKQDMLIVAALAQNGRGFNAVEIKSTLTDERFIDPEDGSPNWEKYFGERGKPGEVWAGGHQKVFGKQYDTQFMLKLYINDLRELYNRGWELPFGLTEDDLDEVEETYYTNLEFDDL
jgi:hypothetical protein